MTVLELAKYYDFEEENQYYNYILDSITNGQRQQARMLYGKLMPRDKETCRYYVKSHYNTDTYVEFLEVINEKQEF